MENPEIKNFVFCLKNEKLKTYEKISWILILLNISIFLYLGLMFNNAANAKWLFIGSALVLFISVYTFIRKKNKDLELNYSSSFAVSAFIWFKTGFIWPGIINILLLVFEIISKRKFEIVVNESFIHYPSFPKKEIEWSELTNIILKDGILTIDMKNNKLIQVNIEESTSGVEEKYFNDFCKERLTLTQNQSHRN